VTDALLLAAWNCVEFVRHTFSIAWVTGSSAGADRFAIDIDDGFGAFGGRTTLFDGAVFSYFDDSRPGRNAHVGFCTTARNICVRSLLLQIADESLKVVMKLAFLKGQMLSTEELRGRSG